MSADKRLARPRQVTTAGVMGVVGSALVVLSLFDALQRLRSVEMREGVEKFLAEPPGDGLGVTTGWVLDALHVLVLFNGALAATAAVLAVYAFQRNRVARIGFTVVAALLLLTSPFSGGAMAMIVAFAATMLWSRPARDWFAGRESTPARGPRPELPDPWSLPGSAGRPEEPRRPVTQDGSPSQDGAPEQGDSDPQDRGPKEDGIGYPDERPAPAAYPFGSRPDPSWAPPAFDQQPGTPSWAAGTRQDPDRRPVTVSIAAAITWLFAGITTLVFLLVVALLMFGQDALVEAVRADARFDELNVSVDDLLAVLWVVSAVAIFWSVCALALAALAFRRVGWARILLVVSAAMTAVLSISGGLGGLLLMIPAVATVVLLFTGGANAWFARRGPSFGPPPQQPPGHQPTQHRPGKPPVW